MAPRQEGYAARAWALLTRDEGWIKPLLVLAAARLIPIVGAFGVEGYGLEWGRLTAWGIDAAPKQKNVDIAGCIRSGARAFVVALGYGFVLAVLRTVLVGLLDEDLGGLLSFVVGVLGAIVVMVAKLRSAVYQTIGAGYQVERIFDMIRRDFQGLLRVLGLGAIIACAVMGIVGVLAAIVLLVSMGGLIGRMAFMDYSGTYMSDAHTTSLVISALGSALPMLLVLGYVGSLGMTFMNLMTTTATALWMRQFDVPHWGASSDPLPGTARHAHAQPSEPQVTVAAPEVQPVAHPAPEQPDVQEPATWQEQPSVSDEADGERVVSVTPLAHASAQAPAAQAVADEGPIPPTGEFDHDLAAEAAAYAAAQMEQKPTGDGTSSVPTFPLTPEDGKTYGGAKPVAPVATFDLDGIDDDATQDLSAEQTVPTSQPTPEERLAAIFGLKNKNEPPMPSEAPATSGEEAQTLTDSADEVSVESEVSEPVEPEPEIVPESEAEIELPVEPVVAAEPEAEKSEPAIELAVEPEVATESEVEAETELSAEPEVVVASEHEIAPGLEVEIAPEVTYEIDAEPKPAKSNKTEELLEDFEEAVREADLTDDEDIKQ